MADAAVQLVTRSVLLNSLRNGNEAWMDEERRWRMVASAKPKHLEVLAADCVTCFTYATIFRPRTHDALLLLVTADEALSDRHCPGVILTTFCIIQICDIGSMVAKGNTGLQSGTSSTALCWTSGVRAVLPPEPYRSASWSPKPQRDL